MAKRNEFKVPDPITPDWYTTVYLQSRHWQWRRDLYMKHVGYYCEAVWDGRRCQSLGTECHHLNSGNLYGEKNEDLLLLCRRCHERMHKWSKAANDNNQMEFLFALLDNKKQGSVISS
jgi:5-methylcytosine-specific restriction endonuclease McrA